MIEIKETGKYFETDSEGFLINPAEKEKIQPEWKPLVDEIVEVYKKEYGSDLVSVYIRGSVGKGTAIQNISDVDTLVFVDLAKESIGIGRLEAQEAAILENYPFATGIEFLVFPKSDATYEQFWIAHSALVYGKDLLEEKFKLDERVIVHSRNLERLVEELKETIDTCGTVAGCEWLCKQILRSAIEVCFAQSGKYSRDLYRCWETFAQYYPEKSDEMKEVLHFALNPTDDSEKVYALEKKWTAWIIENNKEQQKF